MPTLNWIGKDAVEKHHKEVPFRLLEPVDELSCGDTDSGNLIVQGDNLHALKALLPRYAGQVKCIYIDPPYNTGNEGWVYNDNVNSPEIRKWLGEVVGKEGETLDRHDRWLCMMYPRLLLLRQFLREDGVIFVSIDDNEVASLRLLMDEIFGQQNFVAELVWKRRVSSAMAANNLSTDHEYVLCYQKGQLQEFVGIEKDFKKYKNPDKDPRGSWISDNLTVGMNANMRPNQAYDLTDPKTGRVYPYNPNRVWAYIPQSMNKMINEGRIIFPSDASKRPMLKRFRSELKSNHNPFSSIMSEFVGLNSASTRELQEIFNSSVFDYSKPLSLVCHLISQITDKNALILDSFSGSGTTGHAVMKQNSEDGGNRRFILIEMDKNIAETVTSERIKKISTGYTTPRGKDIEGLGSGFQYCQLSKEPLFNQDGPIRADVTFEQLAEFVWFMETGTGLNHSNLKPKKKKHSTPYLGQYKDRAVFLLYNGILKDKSDIGGNVLNGRTLDRLNSALPNFEGPRIIYGARSRFDKTKLAKLGITFHQLPYELAVKTWF